MQNNRGNYNIKSANGRNKSKKNRKTISDRGVGKRPIQMPKKRPRFLFLSIIALIVIAITATGYFVFFGAGSNNNSVSSSLTSTTGSTSGKLKILYVNQGNGVVDESNFSSMLSVAKAHSFNTIFFQVYRSGTLLFTSDQMKYFVVSSHQRNLSIFFALYFTSPSQPIPSSIYSLGEDGISLDMSTLPSVNQEILLSNLQQNYREGKSAVTTTNFTSTLRPNLLILETYSPSDQKYIRPGIIAGVEPLATTNNQDYETQLQYALTNSDGAMVFDYYGLTAKGY